MAHQDAAVRRADDACRAHIHFLALGQHHPSREPQERRGKKDPERDHGAVEAGAEDGDDDDGDHDAGNGHHGFHDAHDHPVPPAAAIADVEPERHAEEDGYRSRLRCRDQGDAAADYQPAENVPTEVVRAEPVLCGGALQGMDEILLERIIGIDPACSERENDQDQ